MLIIASSAMLSFFCLFQQCLHLRGMAAYVGDFKRLHRGHITQILRLRRTVPAVVLPRIVVATFVDKNSFSIVCQDSNP